MGGGPPAKFASSADNALSRAGTVPAVVAAAVVAAVAGVAAAAEAAGTAAVVVAAAAVVGDPIAVTEASGSSAPESSG